MLPLPIGAVFLATTWACKVFVFKACNKSFMRRTAEASVLSSLGAMVRSITFPLSFTTVSTDQHCSVGQDVVFVHFIRVEVIQLFIGWVA